MSFDRIPALCSGQWAKKHLRFSYDRASSCSHSVHWKVFVVDGQSNHGDKLPADAEYEVVNPSWEGAFYSV